MYNADLGPLAQFGRAVPF